MANEATFGVFGNGAAIEVVALRDLGHERSTLRAAPCCMNSLPLNRHTRRHPRRQVAGRDPQPSPFLLRALLDIFREKLYYRMKKDHRFSSFAKGGKCSGYDFLVP